MQSNRTLSLVVLLVLVVGAVIGWQVFGVEEPQAPPRKVSETADTSPGSSPGETATGATASPKTTPDSTSDRSEVSKSDPAASDLPSVVGQIVGPQGEPLVGAEIVCMPGSSIPTNFEDVDLANLDLANVDGLDPQSLAERLRSRQRDQAVVRSDDQGRFRARVEGTTAKVSVRVLMRGYRVLDRSAVRPIKSDTDLGRLELVAGAVIMGRVVDVAGNAVVGASVSRLTDAEINIPAGFDINIPGRDFLDGLRQGEVSVTDASGRFELAHAASGEFSLRARHRDFPTATRSGLSVDQGRSVMDILVSMPRSAQIRGTVSDLPGDATGVRVMAAKKQTAPGEGAGGILEMLGDATELLSDMGLSFAERECEIAGDGTFVLSGLTADATYRVWLGRKGEGFVGGGICSRRVEAAAGSFGVALRYEPGTTVTFMVADAKSASPVENLWVRHRLRGGGGLNDMMVFPTSTTKLQSYPEGKVTIANLRPKENQKLSLTLEAIGYDKYEHAQVELPASGTLDLGTLRLEPMPTLRVTVLATEQDRPVHGARVTVAPVGQSGGWLDRMNAGPSVAKTDRDGQCTVNDAADEGGSLKVTCKGFAPATVPIVAGHKQGVRDQVVHLLIGGIVHVAVHGPDKLPIKNANVAHRTPAGASDRSRTDAEGIARFENLAPGAHEFQLAERRGPLAQLGGRDGGTLEGEWHSIEVHDQQTASLALEKNTAVTATLTGVVRENGVLLEGATVAFRKGPVADGNDARSAAEEMLGNMMGRGGRSAQRAKSEEDGLYELTDLPLGEHNLRITHKGRAMPTTVPVRLFAGANRIDVELSMTTLRGVVRDWQGNPVDGAQVTVVVKSDDADPAGDIGGMMARMMPGMGRSGSSLKTNSSGEFALRGVQADVPLRVRAAKKGLVEASAVATVAPGQTKDSVDLEMTAAGKIEITIKKREAFASVQARFVGGEGISPVVQMLRGTTATLDSLHPGTWEVTYMSLANRDPENMPKQTVEVLAGSSTAVAF